MDAEDETIHLTSLTTCSLYVAGSLKFYSATTPVMRGCDGFDEESNGVLSVLVTCDELGVISRS